MRQFCPRGTRLALRPQMWYDVELISKMHGGYEHERRV